MEMNKEIGVKVRALREEKKLTLREFGNALDMDYSHLGRIERGTAAPSMKVLQKIADFFEVEVSSFFGEKTEVPDELKEVGVEWITFAKEMQERNLTPDEIKTVLDLLDKMKK